MNAVVDYYKKTNNISDEEWAMLKDPDKRDVPSALEFTDGQHFLTELYNLKGKEFTIMPDYDADGVTSGIYAYYGLKLLGIGRKVNIYFPDADDGFGMTENSVNKAVAQFPNTEVILTTDNGISAIEGINVANKLGIKTMITDHHEGEEIEPDAHAIINPNRIGDTYPFKGLSGGHVIHKILWSYMETVHPEKQDGMELLLPLVGISTVADMMPIRDENHSILKKSLELMNQDNLAGKYHKIMQKYPELTGYGLGLIAFLTMLDENKKAYAPYNESTFGWVIGPIFNAPRRLTNKPDEAFKLFLTGSWEDAYKQATKLLAINEERKSIVNESVEALHNTTYYQQFTENPTPQSFKTTAGNGVVGIIAGRLTNTYKVPVIVFSAPDEDGLIQGSGRSPEGVHILNVLKKVHEKIPHIFEGFGGHASACGVTIQANAWEVFEEFFTEYGKLEIENKPEVTTNALPTTFPDPYIKPYGYEPYTIEDRNDAKVYIEALAELDQIGPFGQGFPPLQGVITIDLSKVNTTIMGKERNHIKFKDDASPLELIVWSDAKRISDTSKEKITILYEFGVNEWNGRVTLQGIGKDYTLHN